MNAELSEEDVAGLIRTIERRIEKKLKAEKPVFTFTRDDIKTCCDQSKGLLTNRCVDDIMSKYDLENLIAVAATEVVEEILSDYERKGNKLEYD